MKLKLVEEIEFGGKKQKGRLLAPVSVVGLESSVLPKNCSLMEIYKVVVRAQSSAP